MAKDENESGQNRGAGRRFRLAEIFAEANPSRDEKSQDGAQSSGQTNIPTSEAARTQRSLDERASALGVKLPPAVSRDVIATANRVYDTTPRASVLRIETESKAAAANAEEEAESSTRNAKSREKSRIPGASFLTRSLTRRDDARHVNNASSLEFDDEVPELAESYPASAMFDGDFSPNTLAPNQTLTWNDEVVETAQHENSSQNSGGIAGRNAARHGKNIDSRATSMSGNPEIEGNIYAELEQLRGGMEEMYRVMTEMQERGDAQDKVFNTLHSELQDYKNDFIYEHMKPVVRPLLFLFDHMEQFENELATQRNQAQSKSNERRLLSPDLMCENISFFRDQLVEALRICEVTPMKQPAGEVDTRLHKVVDTVPTDASNNNIIQRVVRSGWYLNGRVFRPAEVIVGQGR